MWEIIYLLWKYIKKIEAINSCPVSYLLLFGGDHEVGGSTMDRPDTQGVVWNGGVIRVRFWVTWTIYFLDTSITQWDLTQRCLWYMDKMLADVNVQIPTMLIKIKIPHKLTCHQ